MKRLALTLSILALAVTPALAKTKAKPPANAAERGTPGAGWAASTTTGPAGKQLFHRYCIECHGEGPDKPGTVALQAKYQGEVPALLDQRKDLTAEQVIYTVRNGVSIMPAARKTEISDADLKAMAEYLARKKR
jgi:mono/diheme cytochrome c family protein